MTEENRRGRDYKKTPIFYLSRLKKCLENIASSEVGGFRVGRDVVQAIGIMAEHIYQPINAAPEPVHVAEAERIETVSQSAEDDSAKPKKRISLYGILRQVISEEFGLSGTKLQSRAIYIAQKIKREPAASGYFVSRGEGNGARHEVPEPEKFILYLRGYLRKSKSDAQDAKSLPEGLPAQSSGRALSANDVGRQEQLIAQPAKTDEPLTLIALVKQELRKLGDSILGDFNRNAYLIRRQLEDSPEARRYFDQNNIVKERVALELLIGKILEAGIVGRQENSAKKEPEYYTLGELQERAGLNNFKAFLEDANLSRILGEGEKHVIDGKLRLCFPKANADAFIEAARGFVARRH